jgi:hypothetical protein
VTAPHLNFWRRGKIRITVLIFGACVARAKMALQGTVRDTYIKIPNFITVIILTSVLSVFGLQIEEAVSTPDVYTKVY